MTNNMSRHVFAKWRSSLPERPKSKEYVYGNFFDLFEDLKSADISMDEAEGYLAEAVKWHTPTNDLMKIIYKNNKKIKSSEDEFAASFKQMILNKATEAFYDVYPLNLVKKETPKKTSKYAGIDLHGMSEEEYDAQKEYVSKFPYAKHSDHEMVGLSQEWWDNFNKNHPEVKES